MSNMKTIPQVRLELLEIAKQTPSIERKIKNLVKHLYRRPSVRKAATESASLTPELANRIRNYATRNPRASYITIATRFNVSTGRVSEVLAGKRAA